MDLLSFCKAHGILIDHVPPFGVWKRFPTEDHPRSRNGAVKFMGDHAFVQNHAVDTEVSVWKSDKPQSVDKTALLNAVRMAEEETKRRQRDAAGKAAWILNECVNGSHEYLKRKGFPDEPGRVWVKDGKKFLVIPMRSQSHLVGCQLIDEDGDKKFLSGQRTAGAEFVFDNKGAHFLCEGFATALSVRMVLKNFKRRYTIHVCFSAGNMAKVARGIDGGMVVADHDSSGTGERVAREIGWPFWISDREGEDFNDAHLRLGIFQAGQSLMRSLKFV